MSKEEFEKEKWEFIEEISKKVAFFAGSGQYEENSSEMEAYKDGVSTAIGMMSIDLGGAVKTKGMLQIFKEKALTQQKEELKKRIEEKKVDLTQDTCMTNYCNCEHEGRNKVLDELSSELNHQ